MATVPLNSSSANSSISEDLRNNSALSSRFSTVSETAVLIRDDPQHSQPPQHSQQQLLDKLYSCISWRLMPLFLTVMVLNHVDRTNLAYASITMTVDLHIGPAVYGLGSALFFIPFCIFQIPSNLVVARVGVRRWLAFLLLGWGTVASCMSLIHNVASFFALRLLLGMFEAGAVPAMWYHLSTFYPAERITKPFTLLTIGILLAQAVSGPVAAGFLSMQGLGGLHGWQWLFLLEGIPSVAMSAVVWCCLPDSPGSVRWLSESEKKVLAADLADAASKSIKRPYSFSIPRTPQQQQPGQHRSQQQHLADHGVLRLLWTALCNPWLLALCVMGVLLASASNTYVFFLPMIIKALLQGSNQPMAPPPGSAGKTTKLLPVILTCVPYTLAALSCWVIAHSSQKRKELYIHTAVPGLIGGVFFVLFPFLSKVSLAAGFVCLVFVAVSGACSIGPKTAIVHRVTAGPSQVVAMPMYNSIVVLGGFLGPYVTGIVVQRTGSFAGISVLFGLFLLVFGCCIILMKVLLLRQDSRRAAAGQPQDSRARPGSDDDAGSSGGGGAADGPGGGEQSGEAAEGKGVGLGDAAAAAGLGAVVVASEQEAQVRPRMQVASGAHDRV